jgi:hypothetical protein
MDRRSFLKGLGATVGLAAVPAIVLPRTRKIWQVHPDTPVQSIRVMSSDIHFGSGLKELDEYFSRGLAPGRVAMVIGKNPGLKHFVHDEFIFVGDSYERARQADHIVAIKEYMDKEVNKGPWKTVRFEQLPEALNHITYEPDNIKMWKT